MSSTEAPDPADSPAPLPAAAAPAPVLAPRRWTSEALLGPGPEALIEHTGSVYRLRLTASGKLILTK
jgi:hemin uptake protein HemP